MLRALVLLACLTHALSANTCNTYNTSIRPLIEKGDVTGLQRAFKAMNADNHGVSAFRIPPIEESIWPETSAIKKLISLSRPLVDYIGNTDMWPENNNIKVSDSGVSESFTPATSYHGGIRYIYNCATYQEISCFKQECRYDPSKPVIVSKKSEEIYVPLENFVAANGDAMADHVTTDKLSPTYIIKGFNKLTVRECGARQVFYNSTVSASDCFENLKFFSLPELVEYRSLPEDDSTFEKKKRKAEVPPQNVVFIKRAYFAIMS